MPLQATVLVDVFERDQQRWAGPLLADFGHAADDVRREWDRRRGRDTKAANEWLRDSHRILTGAPRIVRRCHNLGDLEDYAHKLAAEAAQCRTETQLRAMVLGYGLPPVPGDGDAPKLNRARDWQYWRRVLRRQVSRFRDQLARHLGWVHARRQIYCADAVVRWHRQRTAANLDTLAGLLAVSDAGHALNLADVYRAGLANPALRRAELLARIRGFERWAEAAGDVATFVTLTAPSKYHARDYKTGRLVQNWNGSTPRDVNAYLGAVWARTRAALQRAGVRVYGFRIAEPHHDGTPHWHFLLFHRPTAGGELRRIMRDHALAEDGAEPGARKRRITFEAIDPHKGSATGYVIKYVAKSVDGHGVGDDLYGGKAEAASERIVAWARTWGIRQFQQIGGPAVGVWREYRRIQPADATSVVPPHHLPWHAASVEGRWDAFLQYMGGATPGRALPSTLARRPLLDVETGELVRYRTKYGDLVPESSRPLLGVLREGVLLETRTLIWRIEHCAPQQKNGGAQLEHARENEGFGRGAAHHSAGQAATGGPWTRGNNCTRPGARQGAPP